MATMTVTTATAKAPRARRRWGFLARRLGFYAVAAAAAIVLNFLLPRLMPGDPSSAIVEELERVSGQQVPPETLQSIRAIFGDPSQNLGEQFAGYLGQLARFDLGVSIVNFPVPVGDLVWQALPWTLLLVGMTTVAAFLHRDRARRAGRVEGGQPASTPS